MLNKYWNYIKNNSVTRKFFSNIYYFCKGVKYDLSGEKNLVNLNLNNKFIFLKNIDFVLNGNNNKISIQSGTKVSNTRFKIDGHSNMIVIEKNCILNGECIWIRGNHSKICIGQNTTINKATIGIAESSLSITIGKNCMLAHDIDIRCGDSHSIIDLESGTRINYAKDIKIHDFVWLAAGVRILKSLTIGQGSIIGIGSIVTKDIPENCLAVGVPAQVKKTNITWLKEQITVEDQINSQVEKIYAY